MRRAGLTPARIAPATREHDPLSRDVDALGRLLGEVLREQEGAARSRWSRSTAPRTKALRAGEPSPADFGPAGEALLERTAGADASSEARLLVRAFTAYFHLVNLAEERHRLRVLRQREQQRGPAPRRESESRRRPGAGGARRACRRRSALAPAARTGGGARVHRPPHRGPPAHGAGEAAAPGAAWRRGRTTARRSPRERPAALDRIREEITALWLTEEVRPRAAHACSTRSATACYYFEHALWDVVPRLYRDLRGARWPRAYPGERVEVPAFLRFGSWMGGDRDGNPNVTAAVTERTLRLHRETRARRCTSASCSALQRHLSVPWTTRPDRSPRAPRWRATERRCRSWPSARGAQFAERAVPPQARVHAGPAAARAAPQRRAAAAPAARPRRSRRSVWARTPAASRSARRRRARPTAPPGSAGRRRGAGGRPARAGRGAPGAGGAARPRAAPEVFGFHLARLDLRQHSQVHEAGARRGAARAAGAATGLRRRCPRRSACALLARELERPRPPARRARELVARDGARRWRCSGPRARMQDELGAEACQVYIVSMTAGPQRRAGAAAARAACAGGARAPSRSGGPAVRDDRRPAPLRRTSCASCSRCRPTRAPRRVGRRAAGHARLLRQQQGRRLRRLELGAVPRPAPSSRRSAARRASRLAALPRARRRHRPRRRPDAAGRSSASRRARSAAGCA